MTSEMATSCCRTDRYPLDGFPGLELEMADTTAASAGQFSDQGTPMAMEITSLMAAASYRTDACSLIDIVTRDLVTPTKIPCSGWEKW